MEAPRKGAGPPAFLQVSPMLQLWIELAFFSLPLSRAEQKALCQRLAQNPVRKSDHPSSSRQDARPKCSAIAGPFLPSAEYRILAFSKIPCAAETKKYFDRSQLPGSTNGGEGPQCRYRICWRNFFFRIQKVRRICGSGFRPVDSGGGACRKRSCWRNANVQNRWPEIRYHCLFRPCIFSDHALSPETGKSEKFFCLWCTIPYSPMNQGLGAPLSESPGRQLFFAQGEAERGGPEEPEKRFSVSTGLCGIEEAVVFRVRIQAESSAFQRIQYGR